MNPFLPIILFVLIDQTILSENKYLENKFENPDSNKKEIDLIEKYNNYRNYIQIIIRIIHLQLFLKMKYL